MIGPGSLDIEEHDQLLSYLRDGGWVNPTESPSFRTLAGGVSNRTVLVRRPGREEWVIKQALAKLRVAVDWFSDPVRIHCEALGMRWLGKLAPPGTITGLVFEDGDQHLLAMEAVPEPHANWKILLLDGRVERDHIEQFGRLLGMIHRRSYEQRDQVAPLFDDRSFFESLRLEPYYEYTAGQVPAASGFLESLVRETRARRYALVHGDYSPKNVLVHRDRLILLDHEVIHWGDPAFDLGFSLTHLLSKAHYLPHRRALLMESAMRYWQVYRETLNAVPWAVDLETCAVRHTLACLLARVAGRSPLEYLNPAQRTRQREAVLALMMDTPEGVSDLATRFVQRLEDAGH